MQKLFIIHENDEWVEPLRVQFAENLSNLKGMRVIANFLKKELEKTN